LRLFHQQLPSIFIALLFLQLTNSDSTIKLSNMIAEVFIADGIELEIKVCDSFLADIPA
jgi:hypothetical protein